MKTVSQELNLSYCLELKGLLNLFLESEIKNIWQQHKDTEIKTTRNKWNKKKRGAKIQMWTIQESLITGRMKM